MKPSKSARVAAATGIALGLGVLAAPSAFADAVYNPGGDVTNQEDITAVDSLVSQAANNETDIATEISAEIDQHFEG